MAEWKNKLFFGDNLYILRELIPDEFVDLIYLDPPFNSKATYNVLFQEKNGSASSAQITAFEDTWQWDIHTEEIYFEIVEHGPKALADLIQALRQFLGTNDMMAYLVMMAIRLQGLHRVLKATGSIYLHCDPTASHYLKLVMDSIYSPKNFINEISWKRTHPKSDYRQGATNWPRTRDILLHYYKDFASKHVFNQAFAEYTDEYIKSSYPYIDEEGRRYGLHSLTAPGAGSRGHPQYEFLGVVRYWRYSEERMKRLLEEGRIVQKKPGNVPRYKRYLDEVEGVPIGDSWDDIAMVQPHSRERLGYPTQKPEALLERIIRASSNEGNIVLDPFCGCGTTIAVAERLKRRWIGIDITHLAVALMKYRLENTFGDDLAPYEVIGEPQDVRGAEALALQDRHEFQRWAVSLVEGMPMDKKTMDRGIDGYIYFHDDRSGKAKKVMIEVKSGHVNSSIIRSLKGVVEREKAQIGLLITLQKPTREMVKEAASAGFYESEHFGNFPKIQILTIEELLEGKEIKMPSRQADVTHKKAKRAKVERGIQEELVGEEE